MGDWLGSGEKGIIRFYCNDMLSSLMSTTMITKWFRVGVHFFPSLSWQTVLTLIERLAKINNRQRDTEREKGDNCFVTMYGCRVPMDNRAIRYLSSKIVRICFFLFSLSLVHLRAILFLISPLWINKRGLHDNHSSCSANNVLWQY